MTGMERRAVSSMNYIFLRAVFKENYSDSITEELPYFLNGVVINIKNDPERETEESGYLYEYIFQEIDEGDYSENLIEIPQKIKEFCMKLDDMQDDDIDLLCSLYREVCEDVKKKWESLEDKEIN